MVKKIVAAGGFWLHGFFQRGNVPDDGEECVDPCGVADPRILGNASGKGQDPTAVPLRQLCHAHRDLAHGSLPVQAALAGDDQVGVPQGGFQAHGLQHDVDAGAELHVGEEIQEGESQAARRAGAGRVHAAFPGEGLRGPGVMAQGGVHLFDLPGLHALLGAVYRHGAPLSAEGIGYVAGNPKAAVPQRGPDPLRLYAGNFSQTGKNRGQQGACLVKERPAQGGEHADAALRGGGAADSDEKVSASGLDRIQDHLADAHGAGPPGVQLVPGDQGDAGGLRHLHHGGLPVGEDAVPGPGGFAEGAFHLHAAEAAAQTGDQGLHGALAAVGQGLYDDLRLHGAQNAPPGGLPGLHGAQASLEGVDCDDDLHVFPPSCSEQPRQAAEGARADPGGGLPEPPTT